MVDWVVIFLGATLTLYGVLGGADFGAGLWEALKGKRCAAHEALVTAAMGPVWEANHVWLIIAVVILFTGFPAAFQQISVTFHLPLTLALFGIALRGCAFTFRHYDAVKDRSSQRLFTFCFEAASIVTPTALGAVAGGLLLGRIPAGPVPFADAYVWPWLNPFCVTVGVFLTALCALVAAVFLAGEATDGGTRELFATRARLALVAAVVIGGGVFGAGELSGIDLASRFLARPLSLGCLVAATALIPALELSLRQQWPMPARLTVAAQFALVLTGWFALQYPVLISREGGTGLTAQAAAAPVATLTQLLIALTAGGVLLVPALAYLLYVFKIKRAPAAR